MSKSDLAEFETERRAESALQLLRSLAKAGEDPDTFAQACLDWSRLEKDATAVPDFLTVLGLLSGDGNHGADESRSDNIDREMFRVDPDGTVVSIPTELALQLGLEEGSSIAHLMSKLEYGSANGQAILISIPDSFRIERQVRLYPIMPNGHDVTGYLARAVLSRFGPHVQMHLHEQYGLTKSEIQILELVLRRHTLEQVAEIRTSSLNTVRTHIARLISKLGCHSLVEAVATALEIANALGAAPPSQHDLLPAEEAHQSEVRVVGKRGHEVEFRHYGLTSGRPVMILHSLEYGFVPSDLMVQCARARGLHLIFPIRPGFGATSVGSSIEEDAEIIKALIDALDLRDLTLVGLSFSGPLALAIQDKNPRVAQTSLINYGLNARDKMENIHPKWVRGMLRMALSSTASFAFGANTTLSMIRTFGGLRFFRTVYRNQESDQNFVEANSPLFEMFADYIAKADKETLRKEIRSALLPNPAVDRQIARARALNAMISCDQNGVGSEETKADAKRLGLTFRTIEHTGRNWLFQYPDTLFDELFDTVEPAASPLH